MIITGEITRVIHQNENFKLVGCIPIGEYSGLYIHPTYHTITIKDTQNRLLPNKRYTLDIDELPANKYGTQYILNSIPSLSFNKVDDITDEMEYELLQEIMNENQARYVHDAYPNFIRLIMNGDSDKIDTNKIYNVSHKRMNQYINGIAKKYNSFLLSVNAKDFELTQSECRDMLSVFDGVDECIKSLNEHPYQTLIDICKRGFRNADTHILLHDSTFKNSEERLSYMLSYAIEHFEIDGSTYVDAVRVGEYIATIDYDVLSQIKNVAKDSDMIHYDEDKNILQRQKTYEDELYVANFINDILSKPIVLDWDWTKYTKIKDGELTGEQRRLLEWFCKNRIVLLDAPSGTGKTSSLMALIDMIEDNDLSYIMMSPTGKASSRLSEQTGRPASTIHRGVLSNQLYDKDVIIIDESSMLSLPLINMVLRSDLLPTCRLVFVGDSAQIPPIGLGRIFKDMGESEVVPKVTLTKCFRFEEGGASYISTLTRQGKFYIDTNNVDKDRFTLGEKQDYEFIKFNGHIEQIVDVYMSLINEGAKPADIILLTPYNIGSFGATKLNNLIQERINPITDDLYVSTKHNDTNVRIHRGDLIMNTKNNYRAVMMSNYKDIEFSNNLEFEDVELTSIYNGQIGSVVDVTKMGGTKVLVADIEGEDIMFTSGEVNNLLLGYASNPYKYQGSQCKYVINVVIGAHGRVLNRNLLYTAQTRMTNKLIEIGDIDIIMDAVSKSNNDSRKTRLTEFLHLTK